MKKRDPLRFLGPSKQKIYFTLSFSLVPLSRARLLPPATMPHPLLPALLFAATSLACATNVRVTAKYCFLGAGGGPRTHPAHVVLHPNTQPLQNTTTLLSFFPHNTQTPFSNKTLDLTAVHAVETKAGNVLSSVETLPTAAATAASGVLVKVCVWNVTIHRGGVGPCDNVCVR